MKGWEEMGWGREEALALMGGSDWDRLWRYWDHMERLIGGLPDRLREALLSRYGVLDGPGAGMRTWREVGEVLGVSRERARQIVMRAERLVVRMVREWNEDRHLPGRETIEAATVARAPGIHDSNKSGYMKRSSLPWSMRWERWSDNGVGRTYRTVTGGTYWVVAVRGDRGGVMYAAKCGSERLIISRHSGDRRVEEDEFETFGEAKFVAEYHFAETLGYRWSTVSRTDRRAALWGRPSRFSANTR